MSHNIDLTRVEGNARIIIEKKEGKLKAKINVYESSRDFEKFLIGRYYKEIPDLTSRICGICFVPHKLACIKAIENIIDIKISKQTQKLREVLNFGSTMYSHLLHLFFMVLPDIKKCDSVFEYEKELMQMGLKLIEISSEVVKIIGGRDVHVLTPIIGGFSKLPDKKDIDMLIKKLKESREICLKLIDIFSNLEDYRYKRKTQYLSLKDNKDYPNLNGDIVCDNGAKFKGEEYKKFIKEYNVDYSTSKFATFKSKSYMVGALSRLNNNSKYLPHKIKKLVKIPNYSPFYNNFAQTLEIYLFLEKIIEILENLDIKKEFPKYEFKSGEGIGVVEAPRGLLIHHYKINKNKKISYANIITPTAQNLRNIEEDSEKFLEMINQDNRHDIEHFLERLVRAYDPCISCATHFLDVKFA